MSKQKTWKDLRSVWKVSQTFPINRTAVGDEFRSRCCLSKSENEENIIRELTGKLKVKLEGNIVP